MVAWALFVNFQYSRLHGYFWLWPANKIYVTLWTFNSFPSYYGLGGVLCSRAWTTCNIIFFLLSLTAVCKIQPSVTCHAGVYSVYSQAALPNTSLSGTCFHSWVNCTDNKKKNNWLLIWNQHQVLRFSPHKS